MGIRINEHEDEFFDYVIENGKRIPTILFCLENTQELDEQADSLRRAKGFIPMYDDSGEYDEDGWYDFYLEVLADEEVKFHLFFIVDSETAEDAHEDYDLPCPEDIERQLNRELGQIYNRSLNSFILEAKIYAEND